MTRTRTASSRVAAAALALVVLVCAGCGHKSDDAAGAAFDAGAPASNDACDRQNGGAITYHAGVESYAADRRLGVRILDAVPAPPAVGDNRWTVQVVDASGAPLHVAAVYATTYMPARGFGSTLDGGVGAEAGADDTTFGVVVRITLPGAWQVTLHVVLPDATTDEASFLFCVDS